MSRGLTHTARRQTPPVHAPKPLQICPALPTTPPHPTSAKTARAGGIVCVPSLLCTGDLLLLLLVLLDATATAALLRLLPLVSPT